LRRIFGSGPAAAAVACITTAILVSGVVAGGATNTPPNTYYACAKNGLVNENSIRVNTIPACTRGYAVVSWGETGPQGGSGLQGVQGTPGVQGGTGLQGVAGVPGGIGGTGLQGMAGKDGVDGAPGSIGGTGVQGVAGKDGIDGAPGGTGGTGVEGGTGPQGTAGVSGYVQVNSGYLTVPANQPLTSYQVNCPTGKYILSGGYQVNSPSVSVLETYPDGDHFVVVAHNTSAYDQSIILIALCATPS